MTVLWEARGKFVVVNLELKAKEATKTESAKYFDKVMVSKASNGEKYLTSYGKEAEFNEPFTAPVGAVVIARLTWGSRKYTRKEVSMLFRVAEGQEGEIEEELFTVKYQNLAPIPLPSKEVLKEIEAEIKNNGYLPTEYAPIRSILYAIKDEFSFNRAKKPENTKEELAVSIVTKVLHLKPEVLKELGYDVEELKKIFAIDTERVESTRAKLVTHPSPSEVR